MSLLRRLPESDPKTEIYRVGDRWWVECPTCDTTVHFSIRGTTSDDKPGYLTIVPVFEPHVCWTPGGGLPVAA